MIEANNARAEVLIVQHKESPVIDQKLCWTYVRTTTFNP